MPTARIFDQYPPFPNDVPMANMTRLAFDKLLSNDASESGRLFDACKTYGFFSLDLQGSSESEGLLKDAEAMFELDRQIHELGIDEKIKYAYSPPQQLFGILTTSLILSHLDIHLCLPKDTLASLQELDKPSGTSLRLLRYLPQPVADRRTSLLGHTDIGSVTVLFNVIGGLQVLPPGCNNTETSWLYLKPEPGCALINMGDAVAEWSGNLLRSCLHRILYAPGQQGENTRYSMAYLARPQRDVLMEPLRSGDVIPVEQEGGLRKKALTALEWERRKSEGIISGRDVALSKGGKVEVRLFSVVTKATT